MIEGGIRYINESFETPHVTPSDLDSLLSQGWRHFGTRFFRYSIGIYEFDLRLVIPLRIRLADHELSKSQRRVLRKNEDTEVAIAPVEVRPEAEELFARHRLRFRMGRPDLISDFLSDDPSRSPCEARQLEVRLNGSLAAISYFDIGEHAVSAVYAAFDPALSSRSLGIFTMLKEIEYAEARGMKFYYQGYSYSGESFYDYKKRFAATEAYDWRGRWSTFEDRGNRR